VITAGCVIFGIQSEQGAYGDSASSTAIGAVLLAGMVFSDAITPNLQEWNFKQNPDVHPIQQTFAMSSFTGLLLGTSFICSGQVKLVTSLLWRNPEAIVYIFVLSLASAMTQYMISYTIKHCGPITFTLIACLRQVMSVVASDVLFAHSLSGLAIVALVIIVGTTVTRALRRVLQDCQELIAVDQEVYQRLPLLRFAEQVRNMCPLFVCTLAIHVLYLAYSVLQEFLAYHTFRGEIFKFPTFLVAANHSFAALVSLLALQGRSPFAPGLWMAAIPGGTDLVATSLQHSALYSIIMPVQTLIKTLKLLPVMLIGPCLRTRSYSALDYLEALLLSGLVGWFVRDFLFRGGSILQLQTSSIALLMMVGYVIVDAFTSNFEDLVYQRNAALSPAHMLFALEGVSSLLAWFTLAADGSLPQVGAFLWRNPEVIYYVSLLATASALGAYTCTMTVRLFGPTVFTLIMASRQVLSLLLSALLFHHSLGMDSLSCLCIISVLLSLSSFRRVRVQLRQLSEHDSREKR